MNLLVAVIVWIQAAIEDFLIQVQTSRLGGQPESFTLSIRTQSLPTFALSVPFSFRSQSFFDLNPLKIPNTDRLCRLCGGILKPSHFSNS